MRVWSLAGAALTGVVLAGCGLVDLGKPTPEPPPLGQCPFPGPPGGPALANPIDDVVYDRSPPALDLKPTPLPWSVDTGVCIAANGDIHLYHRQARQVTLQFTLGVRGLTWPDPSIAFDAKIHGPGGYGGWPFRTPPPRVREQTLIVVLPALGAGRRFDYRIQYLHGPGSTPAAVEPMIVNH
jgi:hypothetical protein